MTQDKNILHDKNPYIDMIIDFIKNELLLSDFREEIILPIFHNSLYYIIPLILLVILMNFITSMLAVFIVLYFVK
jgi:hypothetical protein